jgi:hypothetical protein
MFVRREELGYGPILGLHSLTDNGHFLSFPLLHPLPSPIKLPKKQTPLCFIKALKRHKGHCTGMSVHLSSNFGLFRSENLKERDHLEDLGVNGTIILKKQTVWQDVG